MINDNNRITADDILADRKYSEKTNELTKQFEQLCEALGDYVDLKEQPSKVLLNDDCFELTKAYIKEAYKDSYDMLGHMFDDNSPFARETIMMGNDSSNVESVPLAESIEHNIDQLLENSMNDYRDTSMNPHNLNALTPFDAFIPFSIVRHFLPMVSKYIVPYKTPDKPFIRFKENIKYIVTRDGKRYKRPDVYSDTKAIGKILESSKGNKVSQKWYPEGTTGTEDDYDYIEGGEKLKTPTDEIKLDTFDLLKESGGLREVGDALDIDVCVNYVRVLYPNNKNEMESSVIGPLEIYPDTTSINPQRSISKEILIPIYDDDGKIVNILRDQLYGSYNAAKATFDLKSLNGYIKQVQFGGYLSNKNNTNYFTYGEEWDVSEHPIGEGYTVNVPITPQDSTLYKQCGDINIISYAVNEFTEMFREAEDTDVLRAIDEQIDLWRGVDPEKHPFKDFLGKKMIFTKEVDCTVNSAGVLKINEQIQDKINFALRGIIGEIRDTCKAAPFKIVGYCHPNTASLFVGSNVDWKIESGTNITPAIRSDYNMGIYTSNGDSIKLISTMKGTKENVIRLLVYPVDEHNFLTWNHYTYSLYFDNNHRINEMPNVPNIYGLAKFSNKCYNPLAAEIILTNVGEMK